MITPAYKLTIGDRVVDTTDEPRASTVVEMVVSLDLDTPVDVVTLELGRVGGLAPRHGDTASIELGYADDDDDLTKVFTGTVATVSADLTTTRLTMTSGARALVTTFVEEMFEGKTAGAIVQDLAGRASVEVERADDGITFPAYVVDGRRAIYHHMAEIAALSGLDLYIDPDGRLVLEKFSNGHTRHLFDFAKHILALDVRRAPPEGGQVEAWGESPTGSAGDDAWGWLTPDFSDAKGVAGTGARVLLERPVLRTRDAARIAADAALTRLQRRTVRGTLECLGRPAVKLGDAIRLRELADTSLNTSFQVRSVRHQLTKAGGFRTRIGFRGIATT